MSFIPTPGIYSKSKLNDELQNFYRLIKLKAYFKDTESTTKKDENTIFIPEKQKPWTPSQNHHSIETFIDLLQHNINDAKILKTNRLKDNSTKGEQKALNYPREMIISSINCHTYKISKYVDHYLQPVMKEIPSYVKDTNDFINKINNHNIPRVNIYLT